MGESTRKVKFLSMEWRQKRFVPIGRKLGLWTAGSIDKAVSNAVRLNKKGIGSILNILGEHHPKKALVEQDMGYYRELIDKAAARKLQDAVIISVKPTQFGYDAMDVPEARRLEYTKQNMKEILRYAVDKGFRAEIDAEKAEHANLQLEVFREVAQELKQQGRDGMLGVCLQANYKRSLSDLYKIASWNPEAHGRMYVRLVKGAYGRDVDPKALRDEGEVWKNYFALINKAYSAPAHIIPEVATHVEALQKYASLQAMRSKKPHIVQMLKFIRTPYLRYLRLTKGVVPIIYIGAIGDPNNPASVRNADAFIGRRYVKFEKNIKNFARDFINLRLLLAPALKRRKSR